MSDVLSSKSVILAFADFNDIKKRNAVHEFLGTTLQPPIGIIRAAKKKNPLCFLFWVLGC